MSSDPNYLPGTALTQADVDMVLARARAGTESWLHALDSIHPVGLTEVPIWYVTVINAALAANHITDAQAYDLLGTVPPSEQTPEPQSLLQAFASLTQTLAVTWPKRRKLTLSAVERMNVAVARARKAAAHG